MEETRQLAAEHRPEYRQACGAHRRHRDAVITEIAADDLGLLGLSLRDPEEARRLEGAVVGLSSARCEEEMIDCRIGERREFFGQLNCWHVGRADVSRYKGQFLHLPATCRRQVLPAVTQAHVP